MAEDGFEQPKMIPDVVRAFPASVVGSLLPEADKIPKEFWSSQNDWHQFADRLFFHGWPTDMEIYSRPDVDGQIAIEHVGTVLRSYQPKHEHKMAGVAWLLSRWFKAVRHIPKKETT